MARQGNSKDQVSKIIYLVRRGQLGFSSHKDTSGSRNTPKDTLVTVEVVDRGCRVAKTGRGTRTHVNMMIVIPGGWGTSSIMTSPTSWSLCMSGSMRSTCSTPTHRAQCCGWVRKQEKENIRCMPLHRYFTDNKVADNRPLFYLGCYLGECRFVVHLPRWEAQMGNLLPDHGLPLAPPSNQGGLKRDHETCRQNNKKAKSNDKHAAVHYC